jgi:hypothetical protein
LLLKSKTLHECMNGGLIFFQGCGEFFHLIPLVLVE